GTARPSGLIPAGGGLLQRLRPPSGEDDVVSLGEQSQGRRSTDPRARTGDDRCLRAGIHRDKTSVVSSVTGRRIALMLRLTGRLRNHPCCLPAGRPSAQAAWLDHATSIQCPDSRGPTAFRANRGRVVPFLFMTERSSRASRPATRSEALRGAPKATSGGAGIISRPLLPRSVADHRLPSARCSPHTPAKPSISRLLAPNSERRNSENQQEPFRWRNQPLTFASF